MKTRTAGALILSAVVLGGCSNAADPADVPAATFTSSASDPGIGKQIMADSAWLQKNRLPRQPALAAAPKSDSTTCAAGKVLDHGHHGMVLPADLMTTMVLRDAKPWAYVRYDVDTDGTPLNIAIDTSAGLKSFDRAAIETVTGWRFDLAGGIKDAHGCVSLVAIT